MHRAIQLVIDHIDRKDKHLATQNKWKKVIKIRIYQEEKKIISKSKLSRYTIEIFIGIFEIIILLTIIIRISKIIYNSL